MFTNKSKHVRAGQPAIRLALTAIAVTAPLTLSGVTYAEETYCTPLHVTKFSPYNAELVTLGGKRYLQFRLTAKVRNPNREHYYHNTDRLSTNITWYSWANQRNKVSFSPIVLKGTYKSGSQTTINAEVNHRRVIRMPAPHSSEMVISFFANSWNKACEGTKDYHNQTQYKWDFRPLFSGGAPKRISFKHSWNSNPGGRPPKGGGAPRPRT